MFSKNKVMTLTAVPMRNVCHDLTFCGYSVLIINVTPGNVLAMSILSIFLTWPPVFVPVQASLQDSAPTCLVNGEKEVVKNIGQVLQKHTPRIFLLIEFQAL